MSFNITVEGGTSVRLPTAGKYCDRDIVVTAEGGTPTPTQEKTVEITANGTVSVAPDEGYALSKVTANVNVPIPEGYIQPSGTLEVTENGTFDVTDKASVNVNVPTGGGGGEVTPPTTPTDGKTRVYIHLEYGRTSPMLGVCPNGTVTVDWGDGTEPDTLTGTRPPPSSGHQPMNTPHLGIM